MTSWVSVVRERRIPATSDVVWQIITSPAMHERLDQRCRLESTTGGGDVGCEYVLMVSAGRTRTRLRYVVTEASPDRRWVAEVDRGGRPMGVQQAELVPVERGTLLRWTVTVPAGRLTRGLVRSASARELEKWLAAVEREAVAA